MKAKVNKEKCIGCQACVSMCGECFQMDGAIAIYSGGEDCQCDLKTIVQSCPADAIEEIE